MRYFFVFPVFMLVFLFIYPLVSITHAQYFVPRGNFGSASCTSLIGWSCDQNDFSQPLTVDIYRNGPAGGGGIYVGSTLASSTNANSASFCGGTSNHGFIFTIPDSLKTGIPYPLYVHAHDYPSGSLAPAMNGSPRTITCSLTIAGSFFYDTNLDGIKDSGEDFVSGAQVSTSPSSTISYPSSVQYQASNLSAGTYNVFLSTIPAGYEAFYPNNGSPPFYTVTVGNGCSTDTAHGSTCDTAGNIGSLRFALRKLYTVTGNVFIDTDRDGVKDGGEGNYSGAVINLTGAATRQTTTGALGNYIFSNLYGGSYTSTLTIPSGYVPTSPNPPTGSTILP